MKTRLFYRLSALFTILVLVCLAIQPAAPASATPLSPRMLKNNLDFGDLQYNTKFFASGDRIYFLANDFVHGRELWVTNGASTGTYMVKDFFAEDSGFSENAPLSYVFPFGDHGLIFNVRGEVAGTTNLYLTNGDPENATLLSDVGGIYFNTLNGTTLYIGTDYSSDPYSISLWKTDGTPGGTAPVKEFYAENTYAIGVQWSYQLNGWLYFMFSNKLTHKATLWKTDGSADGTTVVKEIDDNWHMVSPVEYNGKILFFQAHVEIGTYPNVITMVDLWSTDGTPSGTQIVKNLGDFGSRAWTSIVVANGLAFFGVAKDGDKPLYQSDGTAAGTVLVDPSGPKNVESLTAFGGDLYFYDSRAIYRTRGQAAGGISKVTDIALSNQGYGLNAYPPLPAGDRLFFQCQGGAEYDIFCSINASGEVTHLTASEPYNVTTTPFQFAGMYFFAAEGADYHRNLWATTADASPSTFLFANLLDTMDAGPEILGVFAGRLYFTFGQYSSHSGELWVLDNPLLFPNRQYMPLMTKDALY